MCHLNTKKLSVWCCRPYAYNNEKYINTNNTKIARLLFFGVCVCVAVFFIQQLWAFRESSDGLRKHLACTFMLMQQ